MPDRPGLRIGIVGAESSHVDQIVDQLNVDAARPGVRVTAIARPHGGADGRVGELAARGGIDVITEDVDGLLDHADALVVASRHGGTHRVLAEPFLERGRPVLVDKPLACTVADAEAIVATARNGGALLASYSPLRFDADVLAYADELLTVGPLRSLIVSGPVDPASPYGGPFFYGIHLADLAMTLLAGDPVDVRATPASDGLIVEAGVGDTHLTLVMVDPTRPTPPFRLRAIGPDGGDRSLEVRVEGRYVVPGMAAFLDMVAGVRQLLSDDELLRPVRLLAAAVDTLPKA